MLLNNRYQVLKSIGSGGFGETFIAEDTQMPSGRRCVVKKLHPVSHHPQLYPLIKERFQREAAILEDLGSHSDRIPTLYAYFEENNDFYLVQELIDGMTLTDTIQSRSSFSESYVRDFLVNFLPILDYVHQKHIIHRDIKPDNIIIRQSDQKPVLIDFGAVKEAIATTITSSGSPQISIAIGTRGFMSSEQAAGRPVYSSDLFATGLTAIYLLTGKQPQDIETNNYTGEFLWKQYAPQVSPTLAIILDKVTSAHSCDRYTTAREMLQALQSQTSQVHQIIRPTIADIPENIQQPTVISVAPSKLGNIQQTLLLGSFIATAIIAGFWITKQPEQSASSNPTSTPVAPTPSIASPTQPSKSASQLQESPTPKTPVTPKSPNVIPSAQPSPIPRSPIVTPQPQPSPIPPSPIVTFQPQPSPIPPSPIVTFQPQPSPIPPSPIVTFQPQPSPNYPPTPTPQPLPVYPTTPKLILPKLTPMPSSQISVKLLDKPELYLASTTLVYSDGDRLKADFRVYCPTSMIRPTNYILTDKQGAVKKAGAWWEPSFTPKYNAEYQFVKEVCNKN
ncbi:MAG: protein kinase [Microcoleus sp. PH2017_10_PVI_O_A]|uniref:serine/threonine-protein kinase n=1 Tax=unclassified Microcoleus TaxID=2642155 RepID=UPI001DA86A94|nr:MULTISPECIES: serine/threonine-protein kinase [unclassified Microcoleus]TAE80597.1 MAG: serine/threonine protein kinase [Oscillatoriales cyanobacterium]MCC3408036.1 protein kinase [Microcoleus sp. PH2017_10_PVI_O_A]MCC3462156.1 protein kinase [Microcoleus sp. PH2017_11_PCY_U_A]MCC3480589.1 protein kinase [Microcoleus sp. PH2017_12_PCY_D_A]MCC3530501.1 protein kinase [Microcoleus sp. PH2017_21_RUC_O_A]